MKRLGFDLVAPVRPNRKHLVPDMPIQEYAALVREDVPGFMAACSRRHGWDRRHLQARDGHPRHAR